MSVTRAEVESIAALARLRLTPEEVTRYTEQLSKILEHVERFKTLDLESVEASGDALLAGAGGEGQSRLPPLRDDVPGTTLARDEALYNAPAAEDGLFSVPRILKER